MSKLSAWTNTTLNKCTCISEANNSSGGSCCCGYKGKNISKILLKQGGIRVSREISKRHWVALHSSGGQLQKITKPQQSKHLKTDKQIIVANFLRAKSMEQTKKSQHIIYAHFGTCESAGIFLASFSRFLSA